MSSPTSSNWGARSVDLYELLEKVGQGAYGEVWKGRHKTTNDIVALKMIKMQNQKQGFPISALREIRLLKAFRHEHVVHLKDIVMSEKNEIYLVFEYLKYDLKGILHHLTRKKISLSLADKKCLMQQFLEGLYQCHNNSILHRDLKTSNLLISESGCLKVADFGLARTNPGMSQSSSLMKTSGFTNNVVTLWYRPPELLLGSRFYDTKVDVWSAGCIIGETLCGKPLFCSNHEPDQLAQIYAVCGTPDRAENNWTQAIPSPETVDEWKKRPIIHPTTKKPMKDASGAIMYNSSSTRACLDDNISPKCKQFLLKNPTDGVFPRMKPPTRTPKQVKEQLKQLPKVVNFAPKKSQSRNLKTKFKSLIGDDLALDLLDKMLCLDPSKRITVAAALAHDFFYLEPTPSNPNLIPLPSESAHEWSVRQKSKTSSSNQTSSSSKPVVPNILFTSSAPNSANRNG